jgi:NAD(P)-dependent dehydrogenase (short-subunit alcohol dehydrogenase family)
MPGVCAVVGVGPGNGGALARAMTREGWTCALLARTTEYGEKLAAELGGARAYACNVGDEAQVVDAFARIRAEMGAVDVLLYNAGGSAWGNVESVTAKDMEATWRSNVLGLFLCGRQVIGDMKSAGRGAIVVTGATASLRGNAITSAFAAAKAGQRALAQSMAKYLGPQGIHVALVIVDGVIDLPRTRAMMPDKPDEFFLAPDDIAATVVAVVKQPRSAWTFELDVRPFGEKW